MLFIPSVPLTAFQTWSAEDGGPPPWSSIAALAPWGSAVRIVVLCAVAVAPLAGLLAGTIFLARRPGGMRGAIRSWLRAPSSAALSAAALLLYLSAFWVSAYAAQDWFEQESPLVDTVGLWLLAALGTAGALLKLLVLVALVLLLQRLYGAIAEGRASASGAGILLSLALLAVFIPMVIFRDVLGALDTATTHLSTHRFEGYEQSRDDLERHAAWIEAWDGGRIIGGEALFLVLLAWSHALIGFLLGKHKLLGPLAGAAATIGLCLAACSLLDLVTFTYDTFHNGSVAGPLAFDLLVPFLLWHPETMLATPYVLAFALASAWIVRRAERTAAHSAALHPLLEPAPARPAD